MTILGEIFHNLDWFKLSIGFVLGVALTAFHHKYKITITKRADR